MTKKYVSLEHAIKNAVRDQNYKKKPLNEDFEFEMARNELRTAIDAAKRLMAHLDGEGELEAWVQSKITKGADYLDTVADYMDHRDSQKLKEHTEELMEALGIVGGVFKGRQFNNVVPEIGPGHTRAALKSSGVRRSAKQTKSLTMHGKVMEAKKIEKESGDDESESPSTLDKVKDFALDVTPGIGTYRSGERAVDAYNRGDYGQAAMHAGLTALSGAGDLAIASGIASPIGAGIKGLVGAGARKLAGNVAKETGEKIAAGETAKTAATEIKTTVEPASPNNPQPGVKPSSKPELANDNKLPESPKAPEEPSLPEPSKDGKKEPANNNLEPEELGTGTTGPAPKPKIKEPEKIKEPYNTGVEVTKGNPKPKAPKSNDNLPGNANDNVPATSPAPAKAPATSPVPKLAQKPATKLAPAPVPEPVAKPVTKTTKQTGKINLPDISLGGAPSAVSNFNLPAGHTNPWVVHRAADRLRTEEVEGPDNTRRKNSSKELVGRPNSAGVKDPKSVLARNASIKTKIIDEEKKLAGIIKSVVKKKKEEKESGPNPLVDFEPKLNHKYDNEN